MAQRPLAEHWQVYLNDDTVLTDILQSSLINNIPHRSSQLTFYSVNLCIILTHQFLGAKKNRLIEMVLLSTHKLWATTYVLVEK